uniref:Uncharacterized protein n=1 Tax=Arundo donax TaxID=35708 RepID=A0A0A9B0G6_ARUDO
MISLCSVSMSYKHNNSSISIPGYIHFYTATKKKSSDKYYPKKEGHFNAQR